MEKPVVIVLISLIGLWLLIETKRMRHKIFAITAILLLAFGYFSISYVFSDKDIDVNDVSDLMSVSKIYLSWFFSWSGYAVKNADNITKDALSMNWSLNQTTK